MTPDWGVEKVRKGDVLKTPSGSLRIVRAVHVSKSRRQTSLRKIWFFFAIQHCSWTHAGYTLYNGGELLQMGWMPTGLRQKLNTELDRKLASDFGRLGKERALSCCDVVGLR